MLGGLLPQTDDTEKDLEIFEKLMAFDDEGLARRALIQNALSPKEIAARITLDNPWDFFSHNIKDDDPLWEDVAAWTFPLDSDEQGIRIRWRRDIDERDKIDLYRAALNTFPSYEAKSLLGKRPEEVDQTWLYAPVWNEEVEQKLGEPVFNDSDLQMAGYAAALKVLTAYTHIGGEDVTRFALRPRQRGVAVIIAAPVTFCRHPTLSRIGMSRNATPTKAISTKLAPRRISQARIK